MASFPFVMSRFSRRILMFTFAFYTPAWNSLPLPPAMLHVDCSIFLLATLMSAQQQVDLKFPISEEKDEKSKEENIDYFVHSYKRSSATRPRGRFVNQVSLARKE